MLYTNTGTLSLFQKSNGGHSMHFRLWMTLHLKTKAGRSETYILWAPGCMSESIGGPYMGTSFV